MFQLKKKTSFFFDIESTGLNVIRDRIVQIALIKYPKLGGDPIEMEMLINPGIPISDEAMAVHGITPICCATSQALHRWGNKFSTLLVVMQIWQDTIQIDLTFLC